MNYKTKTFFLYFFLTIFLWTVNLYSSDFRYKNGEIQFKSRKIPVFEETLKRFNKFKVEYDFQKKINSEKKNIKKIDNSIIWNVTELVERRMPELKEENGVCQLIKTLVEASEDLLPEDPNEVLVGACKPVFCLDSNKLLTGVSKSFLAGFPDGLEIESSNEDLFYKDFSTNDLMWICKAAFVFGEDTVMKKSRLYMLKKLTDTNGIFPLKRFGHRDWVSGGFSVDKDRFITVSYDYTAILWGLNKDKPLIKRFGKVNNNKEEFGHVGFITGGFSVDKDRFVTVSRDNTAILWGFKDKPLIKRFGNVWNNDEGLGHVGGVSGGFSVDKNRFITVSDDCTAILWGLNKDKPLIKRFGKVNNEKPKFGHVNCVLGGFSVDKDRFITVSSDHTAILWGLNKDKPLIKRFGKVNNKESKFGHIGWVTGGFLVDENRFITVSDDGTAILWNLNKDKPVKRFGKVYYEDTELWCYENTEVNNKESKFGHIEEVSGGFSVDRDRFVTVSRDYTAILWGLNKDKPLIKRFGKVNNKEPKFGHVGWVSGGFSVDEGRFITVSNNGASILWNLNDSFKDMSFESVELCYKLFTSNHLIKITTGNDDYELFKQFPQGLQELALEQRKVVLMEDDEKEEEEGE